MSKIIKRLSIAALALAAVMATLATAPQHIRPAWAQGITCQDAAWDGSSAVASACALWRAAATAGAGSGGATAANQSSQITQETATAAALGVKTDAKNTATDTTSVSIVSILKQISASIQAAASSLSGTLTVGSHAVTNAGTFAVQSASTVVDGGSVTLGAKADAKSTATDTTAITAMQVWKQISASVQAIATSIAGTVTVSITDTTFSSYETVAASQTAQVLGGSGATGDYLKGCEVTPATTSPGNVILLDNATSYTIFTGGASSVGSLVPFWINVEAKSASGAWKITTGANVGVLCSGKFT